MSGLPAYQAAPYAVTPDRQTVIIFDGDDVSWNRRPFGLWRSAQDMASTDKPSGIQYLPGVGFRLALLDTPSAVSEGADAQAGILRKDIGVTVAPGYEEVPLQRSATEFTGATTGATNLATTGDYWLQKQPGASTDWSTIKLAADPIPYAGPTANADLQTYKTDRVYTAKKVHKPGQAFTYEFWFPGATRGVTVIATIYFSGPPHVNSKYEGNGHYSMTLMGDGRTFVFERGYGQGGNNWFSIPSINFRWYDGAAPPVGKVSITIMPVISQLFPDGSARAGYLSFSSSAGTSPLSVVSQAPRQGVFKHAQTAEHGNQGIFKVTARAPAPIFASPITVEESRISTMMSRIIVHRYPDSVSFTDALFSFETPPTSESVITVEWPLAIIPEGTSIYCGLKDSAGHVAASIESGAKYHSFHGTDYGLRSYQVTWELVSDVATHQETPTLNGYSVRLDGELQVVSPGPFYGSWTVPEGLSMPNRFHEHISITGTDQDPSHETAHFSIFDATNSLPRLRKRSGIPVTIGTRYGDGDRLSVLFKGYTSRAPWSKVVPYNTPYAYPAPASGEYEVECVGAWKRIQESLSSIRWNFAQSLEDGQVGTWVVDAIFAALNWCQIDPERIDVPTKEELPIPLISPSGGLGEDLLIEPGADLSELITQWVRDWLGYWFCFDWNASPTQDPDDYAGMIRVLRPSVPPYNFLAMFQPDASPVADGLVLALGTAAYPPYPIGSGTIPATFYAKDSYRSYTIEPESNYVIVSSTGATVPDDPGTGGFSCIVHDNRQFVTSPDDADFLTYLKPLYFFDPALVSPDGSGDFMRWVTKRLVQQVCHARKIVTFEAPLILIVDPTDPFQCRPRPLRHYDAIKLATIDPDTHTAVIVTAIIKSVNPVIEKDLMQMAVYEVEIPPAELQ